MTWDIRKMTNLIMKKYECSVNLDVTGELHTKAQIVLNEYYVFVDSKAYLN